MNDRQDPYGQQNGRQSGQVYGYDEYGRPLYQAPEHYSDGYDYGAAQQPGGYQGYDGYEGYDHAAGAQGAAAAPQAPPGYGDYGYGYDYGTGQQPPVPPEPPAPAAPPGHDGVPGGYDHHDHHDYHDYGTGQQPPVPPEPPAPAATAASPQPPSAPGAAEVPPQRRPPEPAGDPATEPEEGYQTEQFAFVDEQNDESDDVIDWLKFTESRTERREEAKRRSRLRRRLLVVLLVLAVLGAGAFLWATDRLPGVPGLDAAEESSATGEVREVIAVHLREVDGDLTSTALLVANETTGEGTTLLLPNDLAVTPAGGTTTLGQAVQDSSAGDVRDSLGGLLGAQIQGTWRLDTPYLEILVDLLGGVTVDTNAEVTVGGAGGEGEGGQEDAETIEQGQDVRLDGQSAVAYATHLGEGEQQTAQLERFGQVMSAVLAKMPTDEAGATRIVQTLRQVHDPSITEEELGASLARLAGYAQGDAYATTSLPVGEDGTLSEETADGLVKDVLGGTVSSPDAGGATRIGIRDASGDEGTAEDARIALVNGGFTVVDSRAVDGTEETSAVVYRGEAHRETAVEAARTLGLPEDVVTQGEGAGNADVTITLGADYDG